MFCSFHPHVAPVLGSPPTDITTGTSWLDDIDVVIETPPTPNLLLKILMWNFISDFNLFERRLFLGIFMNFLSLWRDGDIMRRHRLFDLKS